MAHRQPTSRERRNRGSRCIRGLGAASDRSSTRATSTFSAPARRRVPRRCRSASDDAIAAQSTTFAASTSSGRVADHVDLRVGYVLPELGGRDQLVISAAADTAAASREARKTARPARQGVHDSACGCRLRERSADTLPSSATTTPPSQAPAASEPNWPRLIVPRTSTPTRLPPCGSGVTPAPSPRTRPGASRRASSGRQ